MTREEAISILSRPRTMKNTPSDILEAHEMAIKALEQQPCEDTISRQAAIDVLAEMQGRCTTKAALIQNSKIWQQIKDLPSVQPEIIRCYQCKYAEVADKEDAQDGYTCKFHRGSIWFGGSYCSWAERRQDG